MKRLIALLLVLSLLIVFAGCNSNPDPNTSNDSQSTQGADNVGDSVSDDSSAIGGVLTEEALRNRKATPESDFEYKEFWDIVRIDKYLGDDPIIVIPDTINGKPVGEVSDCLFEYDFTVKGVYFPPTVTDIGAFGVTSENLEVVICEGVEEIKYGCFGYSPNLHTLVLGDNLKKLEGYALSDLSVLTEVYIAPSMTEIDGDASTVFSGSDNLTVKGKADSFIESVCKEQGIPFEAV
ncbi:MAG: leucine-rich repeat protein [Ruminococcus sp.]|nr:leucine-rich repeat protein [Ruminococcus sp.]